MSTHRQHRPPRDPMAEREARKYEFPVPSREAIMACLAEVGRPLGFEELAQTLGVEGDRDRDALGRRLRAMERDGQVLQNRRGLYGLLDKMDMVRGRVSGHPDGYGFLVPEEGGDDLFLAPKEMRKVLHGDRAVARVAGVDARGRKEGAIIEVLERANETVVGRYRYEHRMGFVAPEDRRLSQDIFIPEDEAGGAAPGQIVVARITEPPTARSHPVGRIVEVLGDHMAPGMEIQVAIRKHDLPHVWPEEVEREARGFDQEVPATPSGRRSLRELPLVTIDGADARDFDDAVYCEPDGRGWRLVVAIADVSHYVRPGSVLDQEAMRRGNSVYFPRQVIPMLPEALSNGLCSLNPNVNRLCMVCDMEIGPRGKIKRYEFYEGVMRSHARLTYDEVAAMLVGQDQGLRSRHHTLVPHLENLYALYQVLHQARQESGAVDFELPETQIIFNAQRKIERIVPVQRNDAHRLIEECMLAANVCAAEFLRARKYPAPFRIHEQPPPDKIEELRRFLGELGLTLGRRGEPSVQDYARLLASIEGRPDGRLIQTMMLRSLSQAVYSPDNIGHFALGFEHYTHFTSPIRRYPDLVVHRLIKTALQKKIFQRKAPPLSLEEVGSVGEHCSMTERRADEATRDVLRWLKAEYMMERVGEDFDGVISGVTEFGIFVELVEVFVDGLVHITALGNDYFHFDPAHQRLVGDRTRKIFRLGDEVRVRVVRVDLDAARIDLELADTGPAPASKGRSRRHKKKGKGGKGARH